MLRKTQLRSCLLWLALVLASKAGTDLDGDGMCDVWEARYHAVSLTNQGDEDQDGTTNADEALAGTDPFDAGSRLSAEATIQGSIVTLRGVAEPGKSYRAYRGVSPAGPWSPTGAVVLSTGNSVEIAVSKTGDKSFYRIGVSDVDRDEDQVSDWAELQLPGYDPAVSNSFNLPGGDLAGVLDWLNALKNGGVGVSSVHPTATEKEQIPAELQFQRSGAMERPFAIFLKTSGPSEPERGTPTLGEYSLHDEGDQIVTNRLVIPVGMPAASLQIFATDDNVPEVPEQLRVWVGGSDLVSTLRLTDAPPTPAYQRLFLAYLRPANGVTSLGSGLATVLLPGDNDTASVMVRFSNLNSSVTSTQVQTGNQAILQSVPPFNYGGQPWAIRASQFYQTDQAVLNALLGGNVELGIFTEAHVTGEINGAFQAATGSSEFLEPTPPSPPPVLTGTALERDMVRFLTQASFGPTPNRLEEMQALVAAHNGDRIAAFSAWIDAQIQLNGPMLEPYVRAADAQELEVWRDPTKSYYDSDFDVTQSNRRRGWWLLANSAPDQLRQRVGFALSELLVISDADNTVRNRPYGSANYADMLSQGAFGSFADLLENVSKHPMMGHYLSHLRNQKATLDSAGNQLTSADENFAREIMQLFSIGLVALHPDGSLKLGSDGLPIPTYGQSDITELARVMTGWSFSLRHSPITSSNVVDNTNFFQGNGSKRYEASWTNPMKQFPTYHDSGEKIWLGLTLPAGQSGEDELRDVVEHLAAHPNTAPFVCRRLIQRLVTANPSAGYLFRVSSVFNQSGGNLGQTVKAILLDPEARSPELADESASSGKPREPLLRFMAVLRAFQGGSQLPLADLSAYGYPAEELAKFPAGTMRARIAPTENSLDQSPLSAPSVFNWFLPDFTPAGLLSENGAVSPELQIANESTVVSSTNLLYGLIFNSAGSPGNSLPNQTEAPYFYSETADHLILKFTPLEARYLGVVDTNQDGVFTALDTGTFNNPTAIRAACEAVLDRVDLLLCAGSLKARYGTTPGQPRLSILDAAASIRSGSNNSNDATNQANSMRDRIENILWLVCSAPDFVIQR